ncbi:MAG TPA: hypothetical protein H9898_03455 [Candidatus Anaerobiospirillum stercoravium]|nr:hypothetical protein [Candidatus Anaerobiospirillum stercoravium]
MAQDNPRLIVSVSAFGFGDSVYINEATLQAGTEQMINETPQQAETEQMSGAMLPSIIIEDPSHKTYLYGKRALNERTGSGLQLSSLNLGLDTTSDSNSQEVRALVAMLWQQLKDSHEQSVKQEAANRICKHVIQLICDRGHDRLCNRSEVRSNAQIVLLIPDNFTEVEQQCLLNAFMGYELRLLWRSVAALMGAFEQHSFDSPRFLIESYRQNNNARPLVHVLYLGADSFDLSTYEIAFEQSSDHLIPVRLEAVYQYCSLGLNFTQFALSVAYHYARDLIKPMFEVMRSGQHKQIEQSLVLQLLNQNSNLWGIEGDLTQTVLKISIAQPKGYLTKWVHLPEYKNKVRLNQELSLLDIKDFYQRFDANLKPQIPEAHDSAQSQVLSFVQQVALAIKDKFSDPRTTCSKAPSGTGPTCCFIVGADQLVQDNAIYQALSKQLSADRARHYRVINSTSLSHGGALFQERINRNESTYLDRLPKLSTIVVNDNQDSYQEHVLIEEKEISPQDVVTATVVQQIKTGAKGIDLYISNDPNFNDESIETATDISFAEQDISVKNAKFDFSEGIVATHDEPVSVTAMQRPLSGYVKIKIKPQGESQLLPPYGITRDFDPEKTPDVTECLPRLASAYPPLAKPREDQWITAQEYRYGAISNNRLDENSTLFFSNRKGSNLVYYDRKFAPGYKDIVRQRIEIDRAKLYPKLRTRRSIDLFKTDLKKCLPLTMYRPFGWPHDTQVVDLIHAWLHKDIDKHSSMSLLLSYCRFVADHPKDVLKCCELFLELEDINNNHLNAMRTLLENHPRCFKPRSVEFCMSREFAQLMSKSSMKILQDSLKEVNAELLIRTQGVKGSRKLSLSLVIFMYSLLFRSIDRNYLASPKVISNIETVLYKVEAHYVQIAAEVNRSFRVDNDFKYRLNNFVEGKLKLLIPQVIEFLQKKGTNSNIMAALTKLDVEGGFDEDEDDKD